MQYFRSEGGGFVPFFGLELTNVYARSFWVFVEERGVQGDLSLEGIEQQVLKRPS